MTLKLNRTQAKAELLFWRQQGHSLLSLPRLKSASKGFSLHIPGYRCNTWYQLGDQVYTNQQTALAAYGELLDALKADCNKPTIKNSD